MTQDDRREKIENIIKESIAYVMRSIGEEPITYKLSPYSKAIDMGADALEALMPKEDDIPQSMIKRFRIQHNLDVETGKPLMPKEDNTEPCPQTNCVKHGRFDEIARKLGYVKPQEPKEEEQPLGNPDLGYGGCKQCLRKDQHSHSNPPQMPEPQELSVEEIALCVGDALVGATIECKDPLCLTMEELRAFMTGSRNTIAQALHKRIYGCKE